jgi:hypothetical protein
MKVRDRDSDRKDGPLYAKAKEKTKQVWCTRPVSGTKTTKGIKDQSLAFNHWPCFRSI